MVMATTCSLRRYPLTCIHNVSIIVMLIAFVVVTERVSSWTWQPCSVGVATNVGGQRQFCYSTPSTVNFLRRSGTAFCLSETSHHQGRTINTNLEVKVSLVSSSFGQEIQNLADLRYHEFILSKSELEQSVPSCSLINFRRATAEIHQERTKAGTFTFLARLVDNDNCRSVNCNNGYAYNDQSSFRHCNYSNENINGHHDGVVVGSAELSPLEVQGSVSVDFVGTCEDKGSCQPPNSLQQPPVLPAMYVTDVVTSSSHRRLGIGSRLMKMVEETAWKTIRYCSHSQSFVWLFLHVEIQNVVAQQFYHGLGYRQVSPPTDQEIVSLAWERERDTFVILTQNQNMAVSTNLVATKTKKEGMKYAYTLNDCDDAITLHVNVKQLAINAGTEGQMLMVKRLYMPSIAGDHDLTSLPSKMSIGVPRGFGKQKQTNEKEKRKVR